MFPEHPPRPHFIMEVSNTEILKEVCGQQPATPSTPRQRNQHSTVGAVGRESLICRYILQPSVLAPKCSSLQVKFSVYLEVLSVPWEVTVTYEMNTSKVCHLMSFGQHMTLRTPYPYQDTE